MQTFSSHKLFEETKSRKFPEQLKVTYKHEIPLQQSDKLRAHLKP